MNGRESKRLRKIADTNGLSANEFRRLKKELHFENLHNRMPNKSNPLSKKMHKGENLFQFRKRRKLCNAKRRLWEQGSRQQIRKKCINCGQLGPHFVPPTGKKGTRHHNAGFFLCQKKAA